MNTVLFLLISVLSMREADFTLASNPDAGSYMGPVAGWITFVGAGSEDHGGAFHDPGERDEPVRRFL